MRENVNCKGKEEGNERGGGKGERKTKQKTPGNAADAHLKLLRVQNLCSNFFQPCLLHCREEEVDGMFKPPAEATMAGSCRINYTYLMPW